MPDAPTAPASEQHTAGLEVREVLIRAVDADKREVYGIAVPWDQEVRVYDWLAGEYLESVTRGACEARDGEPKAFWLHREVIGRATAYADGEDGWEVTLRISETSTGNDALALVRDGAVDRFSIGFLPIEHTEREDEDGMRHVTRTRIEVREVSLVPFPAYDGAKVAGVRHQPTTTNPVPTPRKESTMPETTSYDDTELREALEDLTRQMAAWTAAGGPAGPEVRTDVFGSLGEYVRAAVLGEERAIRAFEGAVSGDGILKDAWIGDVIQLQTQAQPILQAFGGTGNLPPDGMNVEWGVITEDTTDFDRQLAEGDNLVVGKIKLGTKTAPIVTAGGAANISVQAIQRTTNVNLLTTLWEALILKAARYVELLHRKAVEDAVAAAVTAGDVIDVDFSTARGMVEASLDVVEFFDGIDLNLDGIFASKSQLLDLYDVAEFKSALALTGTAEDKVGALSVAKPGQVIGHIAGVVPVRFYPNAPADFQAFAYDKRSVRTLEAPGAPFRITNELRAIDLTKPVGAYTYASSFAQRPAGIVPLAGLGGTQPETPAVP